MKQQQGSMNSMRFTEAITLSHGSGGKAMRDLVEKEIVAAFENPLLTPLEDQARIPLSQLAEYGDRLAFTTDSFVVDPIFFPGGDIGSLAVNGTVNDLAMGGAQPLYLTCGFIIEEGLPLETFRQIVASMRRAADKANVAIVSGDTKVVHRGTADKIFINTSGVGVIASDVDIRADRAKPGDVVIVNGWVGDHAAAIMTKRNDLAIKASITSDCHPLTREVQALQKVCPDIHCLRDATRGGLATVLNEFAHSSQVRIVLEQSAIPVRPEVRGLCELLGLDPLYLANEGKFVAVVPQAYADDCVAVLRRIEGAEQAAIIGKIEAVAQHQPKPAVTTTTSLGSERLLDMLIGDQLPRIC
ncbi:hydrogenase expression/formation protein HypE [Vibrio sp. vnigr-6D03]|uniref:hydrogenase expression/formation protein HypE n=1 Tax=Vibrio sp. vnigr-6D03 TaxID=2058088 RepID=UPI001F1EC205|nr:hydrogenase expression/formation protein HypE [Vibrio sp. vnigr-6D03]